MDKKLIERIKNFTKDRNWSQFHTGENLAKSINIEAAELLELYQWNNEPKNLEDLKDELADVLIYSIMLADKYNFDVIEIMNEKLSKNEKKYPINKSYGNSKKYDEF